MFERFSDGARRAVVVAQEEARLLDHDYIGTEHILLGLLRVPDGPAWQALTSAGVTLETARAKIEELVGRGPGQPEGRVPFTPDAKRTLEMSLREALQLGNNSIGTEHLLLGLIRVRDCLGAQVLVALGADLADVRTGVIERGRGEVRTESSEPERRATVGTSPALVGTQPWASAGTRCSFCGRSEERVTLLVIARGVRICDACVTEAYRLTQEAPAGAPGGKRLRLRMRSLRPADAEEAGEAIERIFETLFGGDGPEEERLALIEDGEHLAETMRALRARAAQFPSADATVERVRFLEPDEAEVMIGFWLGGATTPMLLMGHAVRIGGGWKVSRETYCRLAQMAGVPCPPRE